MKHLLILSLVLLAGCKLQPAPVCEASGETYTNHVFGKWMLREDNYQYRSCDRCGFSQCYNTPAPSIPLQ